MRRGSLEVLACPSCLGRLELVEPAGDAVENGTLRCTPNGHEYPILSGIPRLVRGEDAAQVQALAASYPVAWAKDGWGSSDEGYLRELPYHDTTGRRSAEWHVKARSMEGLFRVLHAPLPLRIVDLGCGMGWLSHQLARRGHQVFAVDILLDPTLGLDAAGRYVQMGPYFERVWGELHRAPFQSGSVDAVVCNASLHYASPVHGALEGVARILRTGGLLVVMNSPVHRNPSSASRAEADFREHLRGLGAGDAVVATYHHFVRSDLISALEAQVGPVAEARYDPGRWFRISRWLKGLGLRMELASFPILVARKRSEAGLTAGETDT